MKVETAGGVVQPNTVVETHLDLIGEDIFDNFESMFLFDVNIYMIPIQIFDSSINVVSCNPESE